MTLTMPSRSVTWLALNLARKLEIRKQFLV